MARRIVDVVALPDAHVLALTDVIETTIEMAVAAEREACADCTDVDGISAREAGERIRARGTK
jgi:hypothetical protein